jgi:hypothetical protein
MITQLIVGNKLNNRGVSISIAAILMTIGSGCSKNDYYESYEPIYRLSTGDWKKILAIDVYIISDNRTCHAGWKDQSVKYHSQHTSEASFRPIIEGLDSLDKQPNGSFCEIGQGDRVLMQFKLRDKMETIVGFRVSATGSVSGTWTPTSGGLGIQKDSMGDLAQFFTVEAGGTLQATKRLMDLGSVK